MRLAPPRPRTPAALEQQQRDLELVHGVRQRQQVVLLPQPRLPRRGVEPRSSGHLLNFFQFCFFYARNEFRRQRSVEGGPTKGRPTARVLPRPPQPPAYTATTSCVCMYHKGSLSYCARAAMLVGGPGPARLPCRRWLFTACVLRRLAWCTARRAISPRSCASRSSFQSSRARSWRSSRRRRS